jgi:hypothetical protein
VRYLIQVDIGGHPPSPTGPKHVSGNFGNLLFLAVFNFGNLLFLAVFIITLNKKLYRIPEAVPPSAISLISASVIVYGP